MPRNKKLKDLIRARMARTGEKYAAARAQMCRDGIAADITAKSDARSSVDQYAAEMKRRWLAKPLEEIVRDLAKPVSAMDRILRVSDHDRLMTAIRGPSIFVSSDAFDTLEVFTRVRMITEAVAPSLDVARMMERQALKGGYLPNRSAGRMLAWVSREASDPIVRAFSEHAWSRPDLVAWRSWVGLVLHVWQEFPTLKHAATMMVQNDPVDAERCYRAVHVPPSAEARASLAVWLKSHVKSGEQQAQTASAAV